MRILMAPDSFKGSLPATAVAEAIATGWLKVRPNDEIKQIPVADGGEGTVVALLRAVGGELVECEVTGPLGGIPFDCRCLPIAGMAGLANLAITGEGQLEWSVHLWQGACWGSGNGQR